MGISQSNLVQQFHVNIYMHISTNTLLLHKSQLESWRFATLVFFHGFRYVFHGPPPQKKTDVTLPRTNSWQLSGFPKKEIHEFSNPRVSGAVFILKGFSCLLFSRGAGSMMVHGWVHGQNGPSRIRSHSEFGEIPRLHRWSWTLSSPFQSLDISRRYDKIYHPKN